MIPCSVPFETRKMRLAEAIEADKILDGALLLYRGHSLISAVGRGLWKHAAMAAWWDDCLMCLEFRSLFGGRCVTLESQVRKYPGQIDVFHANASTVQRMAAVAVMREKCGKQYDYSGIVAAAMLHTPIIRYFLRPDLCDGATHDRWMPEFCSAAWSNSYRTGAELDPVPMLADRLTEPSDLGRSRFVSYRVTLIP